MIYSKFSGRLGNQLFQYATLRAIQKEYYPNSNTIKADFSGVYRAGKKNEGFENSLKYFNVKEFNECKENDIPISLLSIYKVYRIFSKFIKIININKLSNSQYQKIIDEKSNYFINKLGLFVYSYGYYKPTKIYRSNALYIGHFESPKYFNSIKKQLQEEFTPKYGELEKNKDLYSIIRNCNSVCVTIRRGDYISNEKWSKKFNICTKDYFEKAIKKINEMVENPVFIFFSDEIEWVKQNINYPQNSYFESGDDPIWEKLRLMYNCKNFIISNSTFSWWAQYLSRNEEKIVIAPSRWNNDSYYIENSLIDIYEEGWTIIDV